MVVAYCIGFLTKHTCVVFISLFTHFIKQKFVLDYELISLIILKILVSFVKERKEKEVNKIMSAPNLFCAH